MKNHSKEKIPWAKPCLGERERDYVVRALDSTWISGGAFVDKFEADFARAIGTKYAVTTSNGTTALHLALLALGVGPGDEVIVPAFTFVATANVVIQTGATPVYADIDPETWCVDIRDVERNITGKTRAIMPVHIYGNVCDMAALVQIARDKGLYLVEDVAEAVFSKYRGRFAGSFGDLGCFSFQATKTITMGEGGAVLTNDSVLSERMVVLRSHGMCEDRRYWHDVLGYNYRLTNLQAALGCAQLDNADTIIGEKRRVYQRYVKNLSGLAGIDFQRILPEVEPVIWAVAIRINRDYFKGDRDFLMAQMLERDIETRPGFYPFSVMPLYKTKPLPVAESVARDTISLPSYVSLQDEEIDYVCDELKRLMK